MSRIKKNIKKQLYNTEHNKYTLRNINYDIVRCYRFENHEISIFPHPLKSSSLYDSVAYHFRFNPNFTPIMTTLVMI